MMSKMVSLEGHSVDADRCVALSGARADSCGPARGLHVEPGCVEPVVHLGVVLLGESIGVLQKQRTYTNIGWVTHVNH